MNVVYLSARRMLLAGLGVGACFGGVSQGQEAGSILFVRGADRSGGFLEATDDEGRTEQLASITNQNTFSGNHGWFEFATFLESNGYLIEETAELVEAGAAATGQTQGAPIDFSNFQVVDRLDTSDGQARSLSDYDAVVFASNNAVYGSTQIDAVETYIRDGGGALFISDANFGSNWADAPNSDQQFLDPFGLIVNQDRGTYALSSDEAPDPAPNDYSQSDHPILEGVNAFEGEGVSPFQIGTLTEGVTAEILVNAEGTTSDNTGDGSSRAASRAVTENDAALLVALADAGRIAAHFDRNTFFNVGGAGSQLFRGDRSGIELDNEVYGLNLIEWVTNIPEPGSLMLVAAGTGLFALRRRRAV